MKRVYLIYAKSQKAKDILTDDGAIPFSSDTFLHTEDILSPQRLLHRLPIPSPDDVVVCSIFTPNHRHDVSGNHPEQERLRALLVDLWRLAFHLPKENE